MLQRTEELAVSSDEKLAKLFKKLTLAVLSGPTQREICCTFSFLRLLFCGIALCVEFVYVHLTFISLAILAREGMLPASLVLD